MHLHESSAGSRSMDRRRKVAIIPGEDAAAEAMEAVVVLLERAGLDLEFVRPPVGIPAERTHGSWFPAEARQVIDDADLTLFGATSGPSADAIRYLRWGKRTFANVRPAKWRPGFASPIREPNGIDFVIVRENSEDLYLGIEGGLDRLEPLDMVSPAAGRAVNELGSGKFALKVTTEAASERIHRFAFELARRRKAAGRPGRVCVASKFNVLPVTDGLFAEVGERVAKEFPDIEHRTLLVDDFAHRLVGRPWDFDVIVLQNLYGDILSDAAAALVGGLGLAPSGCFGNDYAYFESVHGTAPDIVGQNIINPTATILSAVMALQYIGLTADAERMENAIDIVYAAGKTLTPDQGGNATTTEFCDAILAAM